LPTLLHIDSSPRLDESVTRGLTARFVQRWCAREPSGVVLRRDVGLSPPPHPDAFTLEAVALAESERDPRQQAAAALSDRLLEELEAADVVLIGAPMYNFSVTSGLKAWFDLVSRPGRTFRYGPNGQEGLLSGKQVVAITARGRFYAQDDAGDGGADLQEALIASFFRFMGLDDIHFIHAEGQAIDPATAQVQRARAEQDIERVLDHQ
jgi:FMN-dependent NADH-azoreductase